MTDGIQIGTQGWNYDAWVGGLYPPGSRSAEYLDLYGKVFETVEIDASFYAVPSAGSIESWRRRAPAGFTYSLKLPQEITHERRLRESDETLARFCERVAGLGEALGLVLIQLPPDFSPRSWGALEAFLPLLPATGLRFAVEFRDRAWVEGATAERLLALLAGHGVALAYVDSKWIPRELSLALIDRPTAPFGYVRWMGPRELTDFSRLQIDREPELRVWAEAVRRLRERTSAVFGYFNNHYEGHSPGSCNRFKRMLGQRVIEPETLIVQPSLF